MLALLSNKHLTRSANTYTIETLHKQTHIMRTYTASVYTDGGTRYFDVTIQASDYWEARRRLDAQYGAGNYNYLTEAG